MNKLEILLELSPLLTDILYKEDIMVAVTDSDRYLYYSESLTMDANISYGQRFLEYDLFGHMKNRLQPIHSISPPEYGKTFRAIGTPLFEHKKMVGMLGFGIQLDKSINDLIQTLLKVENVLSNITEIDYGLTKPHFFLNNICKLCGKYGSSKCANCPVEFRRQQEIMYLFNKTLHKI